MAACHFDVKNLFPAVVLTAATVVTVRLFMQKQQTGSTLSMTSA